MNTPQPTKGTIDYAIWGLLRPLPTVRMRNQEALEIFQKAAV
jgi:hypothetical protein